MSNEPEKLGREERCLNLGFGSDILNRNLDSMVWIMGRFYLSRSPHL